MISEPLLHRMKILIIDDERASVVLLEQFLQRSGYNRVLGVTDSRKALETCAAFDPDLILLDLIMPDVDGFAILETLRSADASESFLPIVVLTADISEEAKEHALEAGATDFLVKPVSQTEALLRIRNLLETRRAHLLLDNQRSALEAAVRERTRELRAMIVELRAANQHLQTSSTLSPTNAVELTRFPPGGGTVREVDEYS
jgi:PleD family two-component response regulator